MHPSDVEHVYTDGRHLFTRNLVPGRDVYGEELVLSGGVEYRSWSPNRSKLSALLVKGSRIFPFAKRTNVLYLGAASGTTVSHISDIVAEGLVYCVEMSAVPFRKLLGVAEDRLNLIPMLADAGRPETYSAQLGRVDILYQDVSQRDQVSIFIKNLRFLKELGTGYLMVKARSADATAKPETIFKKAKARLEEAGLTVLESVDLSPYADDHAALVVEKRS